ncbi:MAG: flavin reductase [bacterium]|nr:flavin reductase [bacterium]
MTPADRTPSPFEQALQLLAVPVTVVGVHGGEVDGGLTAAWVMRASMDPPLLAVAIGHERYTHGLLAQATEFSVSVLAEGQVAVARLFGLQSRRDRDKWAEVEHVRLGEDTPALARCAARFLCRVEGRLAAGDHDLVTGRILKAEIVDGAPVLPMRGTDYAPGDPEAG